MNNFSRRAGDPSPFFVVFLIVLVFALGYVLGALNEQDRIIEKLESCDTDISCEQAWEELK